jgi:hypothetical protein
VEFCGSTTEVCPASTADCIKATTTIGKRIAHGESEIISQSMILDSPPTDQDWVSHGSQVQLDCGPIRFDQSGRYFVHVGIEAGTFADPRNPVAAGEIMTERWIVVSRG